MVTVDQNTHSLDGLQEGATKLDRLKIIARDLEVIFSHHGLHGAAVFNLLEQMSRFRLEEKSSQISGTQREHVRHRDEVEPNKIHEAFVANVSLFVRLSNSLEKVSCRKSTRAQATKEGLNNVKPRGVR